MSRSPFKWLKSRLKRNPRKRLVRNREELDLFTVPELKLYAEEQLHILLKHHAKEGRINSSQASVLARCKVYIRNADHPFRNETLRTPTQSRPQSFSDQSRTLHVKNRNLRSEVEKLLGRLELHAQQSSSALSEV